MSTLAEKLHPTRIRTSGRMNALVACILGERWTDPAIAELCITSDGMLLGRLEGDIGFNEFLGGAGEFEENIEGFLAVAELTDEERKLWDFHYTETVQDHRSPKPRSEATS